RPVRRQLPPWGEAVNFNLHTAPHGDPSAPANAKELRQIAKYQNRDHRRCSIGVEHARAGGRLVSKAIPDVVRDLGGAARVQAALTLSAALPLLATAAVFFARRSRTRRGHCLA